MSYSLPPKTEERAKALAAFQSRDVEALVGEAVQRYVDEAAELAELDAISAEGAAPHDAVTRWLQTWGADDAQSWEEWRASQNGD